MRRPVLATMIVVWVGGCSSLNPAFDLDDDATTTDAVGSSAGPGTTGLTTGASATDDTALDDSDGDATTAGPPVTVEFTDDELDAEFGAGVFVELTWSEGLVLADGSESGRLDSRVFDAGGDVEWTSITWTPDAPYGRPLPDGGTSETAFASGNADMDGLVLLLHFDDLHDDGNGVHAMDTSGLGTDVYVQNGAVSTTDGVFDGALSDTPANGDPYLSAPATVVAPGTADFTWSMWVRAQSCDGDTFVSIDSAANLAETTSIWVECLGDVGGCGGVPGRVLAAARWNDGGPLTCTNQTIDDGLWHHLVLRKQGHPVTTLSLFLDGQLDGATMGNVAGSLVDADGVELALMGQSNPAFPGRGDLDELAIWHRALSDTEIADLYLRGARYLRFRVRGCADTACSNDTAFVGPDASPNTSFVDRAPMPGAEQPLPPVVAPALQYEASLARDFPALPTPRLRSVTLRGNRR